MSCNQSDTRSEQPYTGEALDEERRGALAQSLRAQLMAAAVEGETSGWRRRVVELPGGGFDFAYDAVADAAAAVVAAVGGGGGGAVHVESSCPPIACKAPGFNP
jgi:hypothetical protein